MIRKILGCLLFIIGCIPVFAQNGTVSSIRTRSTNPATCNTTDGLIFWNTAGLHFVGCPATNTFAQNAWIDFPNSFAAAQDFNNNPITIQATNDTTTGTTVNLLAKLSSTGAIKAATTDTTVPVYIVDSGASNSGSAKIVIAGQGSCVMDSTTSNTEGFYVIASTGTAGRCHAQAAIPSGVFVVGVMVANSTTSGSAAKVAVAPYVAGVSAGSTVTSVFTRTGAVTAQSGDYTAALVTNAVDKTAGNVYSGGGLQDLSAMKLKPPTTTVSSLPTASSNTNIVYEVTDGTTAADCTAGSGSTRVWCVSNGTSWVTIGGGSGTGSWSSLTNPSGNLSLSMSTNTSTFNTTTAVNNFFQWANTTAAVVGTSQASPVLSLCGTAFHAAASAPDCLTFQNTPGNGTDAAITFAIGHSGSSTGTVTTTVPGPIQAGATGSNAGELSLIGNVTVPSLTSNSIGLIGPNSASFTAYGLQFSATGPGGAGVMLVGAPTSGVSQITYGNVPIGNLPGSGATTVNGVSCALAGTCNVGALNDTNSNATVKSVATTSAVDQVTVTNAATGNPATVSIAATGTDANININLISKGTGAVQCNGSTCAGGGGGVGPGTPSQIAMFNTTTNAVGDTRLTYQPASAKSIVNPTTVAQPYGWMKFRGISITPLWPADTSTCQVYYNLISPAQMHGITSTGAECLLYPGVLSDGANGLTVSGAVAASYIRSTSGTQTVSGADYTNNTTTPSTLFSWTLPATTAAVSYSYSCNITWESTNTTLVGPVFGINISAAPTQLTGTGIVISSLSTVSTAEGYLSNTTTGSQTLVTGPAAAVTSTNYHARIYGTIEGAATAGSTFIVNAASTSGTTATLNIRRGSACILN